MSAAPLIVHDVYFLLKDRSGPARDRMLAACRRYLTGHPGTRYFACGLLAEELRRDVNDRDFDVALHLIFQDQASHDRYQDDARHLQFIAENRDHWQKVRVFDSVCAAEAVGEPSV